MHHAGVLKLSKHQPCMKNNLWKFKVALAALLMLWGGAVGFAQIKPIVPKAATRAVVVGISDYKNEQITDLRFADADAKQFVAFLQSPAGGGIPASQIQLLTNEKATQGQIATALTWLVEESKSGDKAIIYFSGHGDMESLTGLSFLLAYDASANAYSGGGGFPVIFLQSIITRLSTQKQVQVLLVTDACRSGKLAGNEINGAQATTKILSDQFANEVKILSCQPNEFSLESTSWGGGRGVFSYYLIDGLKGLADNNQDQNVTLLELSRYLEDQVPTATAPHSQIPMIVGNKGAVIAQVDGPTLLALQQEKNQPQALALSAIAARAVAANDEIAGDSTTARLLRLFDAALAENRLLEPAGNSAFAFYEQLKSHPGAQAQLGLVRRNLAAKLQDEAQEAINDYLAADPQEMSRRWGFDHRYDRFPAYLEKAAALLGEDNFMYSKLKAREHYFAGLLARLEFEKAGDKKQAAPSLQKAVEEQQKALGFDDQAVFAYNEMGHLKILMKEYEAAVPLLEKAISLSPTWVLPWSNLAYTYSKLGQLNKAEEQALKALKLDSSFFLTVYNLGLISFKQKRYQKAVDYYQKALIKNPDYTLAYYELGLSAYHAESYQLAEKALLNYRDRAPEDPDGHYMLGDVARKLKKPAKAEAFYQKALELKGDYMYSFISLGELAAEKNDFEKANKYFKRYLELEKKDFEGYFQLACVLVKQNQLQEAIKVLSTAFEAGVGDVKRLENEAGLAPLRGLPEYGELLNRVKH